MLNITGGDDLSLIEINEAAEVVKEAADPEANIIFGAVIDPKLKDEIKITVIATGFDEVKVYAKPEEKKAESKEEVKADSQKSKEAEEENAPEDQLEIPAFLRTRYHK